MEANRCIHTHERMTIEPLWLPVTYSGHPQIFLLPQTPPLPQHPSATSYVNTPGGSLSNFVPDDHFSITSFILPSQFSPWVLPNPSSLSPSHGADPRVFILWTRVILLKQNLIKSPPCGSQGPLRSLRSGPRCLSRATRSCSKPALWISAAVSPAPGTQDLSLWAHRILPCPLCFQDAPRWA